MRDVPEIVSIVYVCVFQKYVQYSWVRNVQ